MSDDPKPKPFSLTDFYAKRMAQPEASLPRFQVRATSDPIATSAVGVTRAALPPWLQKHEPRVKPVTKLGGPVAVARSACLAWRGSPCWTCVERCPIAGAIVLDAGRPTVDPTRCDGCGECVAACPAPHNALKLATLAGAEDEIA